MIDEREVAYVLQVAEEGTFSQAAKKLYVTQPSLSQSIKRIEQELGTELFDRRTNPLTLTYAGSLYVDRAKKILQVKQDLLRQIEDMSDLKCGQLRIGTSYSRTAYLLTQILPEFKRRFPGIDITLIEGTVGELQDYAAEGATDLAFVYLPIRREELLYEPLLDEKILAAVPPGHWISRKYGKTSQTGPFPAISFADLADEEFVVMKHNRKMRSIFSQLCEKTGISPKVILESGSLVSAQALVASGLGVTLVTDILALYSRLAQNPYYFSLKEKTEPRRLVIAYAKEVPPSKAVHEFIKLTKEMIL
jgi:LysR family hydrogen peroxide-inducible transcriptional activator